jgi:hypothetical protein
MWILVLVFVYNTNIATTNVTGFSSKQSCVIAGQQVSRDVGNNVVKFSCIKKQV